MAVTFPMDTVYMFEAAVPLFSAFYERYYHYTDPELTRLIPTHGDMTSRVFDGFFPLFFLSSPESAFFS